MGLFAFWHGTICSRSTNTEDPTAHFQSNLCPSLARGETSNKKASCCWFWRASWRRLGTGWLSFFSLPWCTSSGKQKIISFWPGIWIDLPSMMLIIAVWDPFFSTQRAKQRNIATLHRQGCWQQFIFLHIVVLRCGEKFQGLNRMSFDLCGILMGRIHWEYCHSCFRPKHPPWAQDTDVSFGQHLFPAIDEGRGQTHWSVPNWVSSRHRMQIFTKWRWVSKFYNWHICMPGEGRLPKSVLLKFEDQRSQHSIFTISVDILDFLNKKEVRKVCLLHFVPVVIWMRQEFRV